MAIPKYKLGQVQLDVWSVKERLALACSVLKSGDQNWVSVSRAIKPFGESNRPPEWFSQKNCALQYADLLEKVETPKRKRGDRGEVETPSLQIVRKLTIERIEELKKRVVEQQQKYKKLSKEVECVKTGQWDDRIQDIYQQMLRDRKMAEERADDNVTQEANAAQLDVKIKKGPATKLTAEQDLVSETDDSTQDSVLDQSTSSSQNAQTEEKVPVMKQLTLKIEAPGADQKPKPSAPSSPLLSSLLQSKLHRVEELTQLKEKSPKRQIESINTLYRDREISPECQRFAVHDETCRDGCCKSLTQITEMAHAAKAMAAATAASATQSTMATSDTKLGDQAVSRSDGVTSTLATATTIQTKVSHKNAAQVKIGDVEEMVEVKLEPMDDMQEADEKVDVESLTKEEPDKEDIDLINRSIKEEIDPDVVKTEQDTEQQVDDDQKVAQEKGNIQLRDDISHQDEHQESTDTPNTSYVTVDEEISINIPEDPLSPASSVSSKVSECDIKTVVRKKNRGKLLKSNRRRGRRAKKFISETDKKEDVTSRLTDGETTEDEISRESDDNINSGQVSCVSAPATFSESIPNSPLSHCSDTEDEKAYKNWKKSIMLVWRCAANHKYANVFLHPVTNDIAPGYLSIVHRPMDFSLIKKNIENGVIRTTQEFQRDMMLMFTNAVMYNSSNHNVYKMAMEMYKDVMQHIEQYVNTQIMVQSSDTKLLRGTRRSDNSDKEDETKRRRTSSEQHSDGGKAKKRKTRADDT